MTTPNDELYSKITAEAGNDVRDVYDSKHGRYEDKAPAVKPSAGPPQPPQPFASIRKGR